MKGGEIMINYNNTSKLLIPGGQDNSIINLKSKAYQGASDTEFKSVFDKTLNNNTKRTYASNRPKDDKDINNDSKVKYKAFRDAKMAQAVSSKDSLEEKSVGDVKSKIVDSKSKELESIEKYDEQINVLAQILGLQPNELAKLANDLGFSKEDLKDIKKLSLFMDKLSNILELNASQKTIMNTLVEEVSKQVKTVNDSEVGVTLESPKADEATKEANANINTKTIDLSKITDEVKTKLDQLIQKVTLNPEAISSEISKVIEAMKSQIKAKVSVHTEQTETKSITAAPTTDAIPNAEQVSVEGNAIKEKESAKASNFNEETNSESADSKNTKTEVAIQSVNAQVSTSTDQNQQLNEQNMQTIGDVKIGMASSQIGVQKTVFSMPQPIKNSEVLNQVVEQAKVIVGQDKSEMVIQLKPDHLGKLELKVVTEQGIVAAKFIAESQQVKEIIETNMQLLKDSLQKQGISIESINVQVGPDKQSEYQQQNSFQNKNSSSSNRHKYGSSESGIQKMGYNTFDELPERLAQYAYDSNTINLTA